MSFFPNLWRSEPTPWHPLVMPKPAYEPVQASRFSTSDRIGRGAPGKHETFLSVLIESLMMSWTLSIRRQGTWMRRNGEGINPRRDDVGVICDRCSRYGRFPSGAMIRSFQKVMRFSCSGMQQSQRPTVCLVLVGRLERGINNGTIRSMSCSFRSKPPYLQLR